MNRFFISLYFLTIPIVLTSQILEGNLYRETSKPEVYVIHGGKKVWIPTPDALFAMGYRWSNVKVVPDGVLDNFPRFNIPSASATPSSLIFPEGVKPASLLAEKLNNTQKVMSQGREIQLIEIRGWLKDSINFPYAVNDNEGSGFDKSFDLIPDYEWLKSENIDINKIIRVGNIAMEHSEKLFGTTISKKMISIPVVHCEINSWFWSDHKPPLLPNPPSDWVNFQVRDQGNIVSSVWPFDPPKVGAGTYVSVFGSFVTDNPHCAGKEWLGPNGQSKEGCDRWCRQWPCAFYPEHKEHYSRYTEIHPVDLIRPVHIASKKPKVQRETVFGLLLYADITETNSIQVDLSPRVPKPTVGTWRVAFEEILGPECQNPNSDDNCHYTYVQKFEDRIHVTASTCGGGPLSGTPGRIRALYRLWWEPMPNDMNVYQSVSYLDNHYVQVKLVAYNIGLTQLAGQIYDDQGNYLGETNTPITRIPNCHVTKKTKTKWITNRWKPVKITIKCEDWTFSPTSEEFTVKSIGYNDQKIKVNYFRTTCN